ncbi:tyrosine-type recombinase/integrase [Kitasatospora sp. NPDC004614]|uniref:tyrosine-type recombinase/integrase n=1 Tax=unclassified Kitasatospora TaxID=2633591 RepID=UPI0036B21791
MAHIRVRERKDGSRVYTVTWRSDGRGSKEQGEPFADEKSAERFKDLVNGHGQQWPPGWVPGRGFVEPDPDPEPAAEIDPAHWFEPYAMKHIDNLTGVEGGTKRKYRRLVEQNMVPWFRDHAVVDGPYAIRSEHVKQWVNDMADGVPAPHDPPEKKRRKFAAKTIRNQHGLLSAILAAAASGENPLRSVNPCLETNLPRADDSDEEVATFLEHWEAGLILRHLAPDAVDLAQVLLSTGLRWGEATALQVRDLVRINGRPAIRISRAWKEAEDGGREIGPPKSKKSRRTLVLAPLEAAILQRAARGKKQTDILFPAPEGAAWQAGTFRRLRWLPAVEAAQAEGLTKAPRIHDLRHTHASWLIYRGIPLPAISARLGHESIQTTVDRYGHLLIIMDDDLVSAVAWSMEFALKVEIPDDVRQAAALLEVPVRA